MKVLDKFILVVYSIVMLVLSLVTCLFIFNWIQLSDIINVLNFIRGSQVYTIIILTVSIVFMLFSIKCIFFGTKKKDMYKDSILLKNEEGRLVISRVSIENLVNNVLKGFEGIIVYNTKLKLDKENNITIDIIMQVKEDVVIKELTENVQAKIKSAVKKTSDLDIKEINVKVKNIESINNIVKE